LNQVVIDLTILSLYLLWPWIWITWKHLHYIHHDSH